MLATKLLSGVVVLMYTHIVHCTSDPYFNLHTQMHRCIVDFCPLFSHMHGNSYTQQEGCLIGPLLDPWSTKFGIVSIIKCQYCLESPKWLIMCGQSHTGTCTCMCNGT